MGPDGNNTNRSDSGGVRREDSYESLNRRSESAPTESEREREFDEALTEAERRAREAGMSIGKEVAKGVAQGAGRRLFDWLLEHLGSGA